MSGHSRRVVHGWLGAGAITLGVGAALAGGSGVAHAEGNDSDGAGGSSTSSSSADKDTSHESGGSDTATSSSSSASTKPSPSSSSDGAKSTSSPMAKLSATEPATSSQPTPSAAPASTPAVPSPGDATETPYGDLGKWLLQSNGKISDFGGQLLGGKTLLEPINMVILDSTSTTSKEATKKLTAAMSGAGFPAQPVHTPGFQGTIDGNTYSQQPTGLIDAFSNNFFLLPDDHARAFGPAPADGGPGYVWTAAVSGEVFGFHGIVPAHIYVSYDSARDELARQLVRSGATLVGTVRLDNAYDSATTTTGDHDGYAVVIQLNNVVTVIDPAPPTSEPMGRGRLLVLDVCDASPEFGTSAQCPRIE